MPPLPAKTSGCPADPGIAVDARSAEAGSRHHRRHAGEVARVYAPLEGQRDQIREESHDQMRAVLTPDQKPKFDAFMKRIDQERKRVDEKNPIPGPARKP